MITFCIALACLVLGYFIYGSFVERVLVLVPTARHLVTHVQMALITFPCPPGRCIPFNSLTLPAQVLSLVP